MHSVMPVLLRVSSCASITRRASSGDRPSRLPMWIRRTLFSCSALSSLSMKRPARRSSALTSARGRDQFSVEKANSVRYLTSRSAKARRARRMFSAPARWPDWRERPRLFAQRPLPSMITATWRGTTPWPGTTSEGVCFAVIERRACMTIERVRLDLRQLVLFCFAVSVDLPNVAVGQLLQRVLGLALFVLRRFFARHQLLDVIL